MKIIKENDTLNYSDYLILLVDDDKDILDEISLELKDIGFDVICSQSGKEAIDIIKNKKIDVLIIDFFMPNLSGEDTIREIRKFDNKVVILLQTGYAGDKPAIDMLEDLEIQGYHDKTRGFDELLVWMFSCLRVCQQQREIKSVSSNISLARKTIEELKREQILIIKETRLATLGQLVNGIPNAFDFYSNQAAIEVHKLENYISIFSDGDIEKIDVLRDIEDINGLRKSGTRAITCAKKYIQDIEKVMELIKETYINNTTKYSNTLTYDDIMIKFVRLVREELLNSYECDFIVKEETLDGIGSCRFNNDTSIILQVLQTIVISCASILKPKEKARKNCYKCSSFLDLDFPMIKFELNIKTYQQVEFYISIPFLNLGTAIKELLIEDIKRGEIALGVFTSELVIKENFGGEVWMKEVLNNEDVIGVLFRISIPARKHNIHG